MNDNRHNNNSTAGGIGFCGLLTIAFIVLKLTGVISWSWLWVLPSLPHLSRRAPTGTPDRLPARILRSGRGGEKAAGQDPEAEDPPHPAA